MTRRWMMSSTICALMLAGCSDTVSQPEPGEPHVLTTPEPESDLPADFYVAPHLVELVPPKATACSEPPLTGAPDLDNTDVGEPLITETFGPDGCLDERWIREWDGTRPLSETYDWFDPSLAHFTYMIPYAYHHTWTYDADGQLVQQQRDSLEEDTNGDYLEVIEYDDQGRMTRRARQGALIGTDDWGYEELWTYGPHSDEPETHTTIMEGEPYEIVRVVFRPDGQVAERHVTNPRTGRPEQLVLKRVFDTDGKVITEDTWDARTGDQILHVVFERRADGTLQRSVQDHLQNGWKDIRTFDAQERELVYTQDSDRDGAIDYRHEQRWDDAGNLVFISTEYDFDRPEPRYSEVTAKFDDQNRIIEELSTQVWMAGRSWRTTFDYDPAGSGYTTTLDILDDRGRFERTENVTRHIDAKRVAWERVDLDKDGTMESLTIRRWSGDRPLEVLIDREDDGIIDFIEQWHYDAVGQLVQHVTDVDADLVIDARELHAR